MADELRTKKIEVVTNFTVHGAEDVKNILSAIDKVARGRDLQKYWKDQQTLIDKVTQSYKNYNKVANQDNASELLKSVNALKAVADTDLSNLLPDFDKIQKSISEASEKIDLNDAFSVESFRSSFKAFDQMKSYGIDLNELFDRLGKNSNVDKLISDLNNANDTISNLKNRVNQLSDQLEESESGNGIRTLREECEDLRWEIEKIRDEAVNTFSDFLTFNNIDASSYKYEEFFDDIRDGSLSAQEAIAKFKRDYSYLLEGGASFDTTQLQDFSNRLDHVLERINEISSKLDDIHSNGVKVNENVGSGNLEELANVVNEIEKSNASSGNSNIYEALSKILTTLREIGQCDSDNLYHIYSTIRGLSKLNDLKINKASLENLADCLERICKIDNSSNLTNLSLVDFSKFNDLHISKASLNNLAEYLPQIANINAEKLIELTKIDFSNLSDFKIDKIGLDNLKQFADSLRELFQGNDVESARGSSIAKDEFASANERVQSSVDGSVAKLASESDLFERIAKNAHEAAEAKKEFVEANKDVSNSSIDKSDISLSIRNTSQSDKIEQANAFAKELDQTLEQVNIPADSFNEVLSKLDLAKSELGEIIKITKQSVLDSEGKFHDSYTLKDRRGSTEIYGLSSETEKGQLLRSNIVGYDVKEIEQKTKAQQQLTEAMAKGREQAEKSRQAEEKRQQLAQNNAINKALEQEYQERQKNIQAAEKQVELDKQKALEFTKSASEKLSSAISKYSYGDLSDATSMMKQMNRGLSNFGDLSNIQGDISKLSSIVDNIISDLKLSHEQSLSALNQEIKSEQQLQSQKDAFHKRNINAIDLEIQKREEESKMFSSTLKAQMEERQSQISSMESSLSSFKEKSSVLSLKPDDEHRFPKYTEYINKLNSAIREYETLTTSLKTKDIIDEDDINRAKELEKKITNLFKEVKKFSGGEKGYENISATKVAAQINKLLEDNTRMSKEAKEQIKAYYAEVASGNPTRPLKEIYNDALKVVQLEKEAGRGGKSFLSAIKEKMWYGAAGQIANMFGFYDIINYARQGIDTVRELDTAFTEMRKVSDETVNSLKNYQATTFDTADAVGTTAKQIQDSTADWLRLGESMNQAAESAKVSNVLLNVSEFDSIDSATESLVAMSQAYQDLSKMDIVDVLNNIGNNYSISTDGLATALQKSASALKTAQNDLTESTALVTAGNAIVQNPDSVGAGIRTIALRLTGTEEAKANLEELGEETDDVITTTSKLRDTILSATKAATSDGKGFDILDANGNYKSTYEIMQGLADLYDDIVQKDKELGTNNLNLLLETIAGELLPEIYGNIYLRTYLIARAA